MENAYTVLNLLWSAVCVSAFTWFLASINWQAKSGPMAPRRALALGLALVSLFPCVSASDDSVQITLLDTQAAADSTDQSRWSVQHKTGDEILAILAGLLEVLESAQVAAILSLVISLCMFVLALFQVQMGTDRFLPSCAGRAPPSCAASY
jgi:hypothetical protein